MLVKPEDMLLYAVTDRSWLGTRTLAHCVAQALVGGATFVQLREKHATFDEMRELASELLVLCRSFGVPFVINDSVEVALAVGADGVHVGQADAGCAAARAALGPDKIIGVSVQTVDQARAAQAAGADYVGVGAIFGTATKPDATDVSFSELSAICAAIDIPVVAIGGLQSQNVGQLAGTGVDGAAVVSALFSAEDITAAAHRLLENLRPLTW